MGMDDEAKEKRQKQHEKKKNRKAALGDEEKAIRDQLQEKSRHEVMSAMVPSATRKGAAQNKGKNQKKKMSWVKKVKKHMQKNMKKKALGDVAKEKLSKKKTSMGAPRWMGGEGQGHQ